MANQSGAKQRRSRGGNRRTVGTRLDTRSAKRRVLELIQEGLTVASACERVDRSTKTYEYWRRVDSDFKEAADVARLTRRIDDSSREGNRQRAKEMGFAAWRKRYLGVETYWHQLQWIDMIEGREPRDLHPAETYTAGRRGRILINTPPNHAKTTSMTVDYSVYRICCDPNVKIAVISETETMAKKFLADIKDRLTQPTYIDLIADFAPEGGFQTSADIWTSTQIKVAASERTKAQKDPTVEALGIGSQIYGARLDLIFMDDCIGFGNAGQWENQMAWFKRMVVNRPGPGGRIIVVGTRVAPFDLYGQFLDPKNYNGKPSPWSCLAQPAILEEPTEDNPEGRTLWPYAETPWVDNAELDECEYCDGYCAEPVEIDGQRRFPRWDMTHLVNGPKADVDERSWGIIYQQRAIPEDTTFPDYAVYGSVSNHRRWGLEGGLHKIPEGPQVYWILSMDPATTGAIGVIVYALDRKTGMRYVAEALNPKGQTPGQLKELIKRLATTYPIKEVVVEKTGLLTMFTQDAELRRWLTAHGVRFTPHYTSGNKWDAGFGVAAMATLFGSWDRDATGTWREIENTRLIDLPRLDTTGLKALVQQLLIWSPELDPKKVECDMVMALWFAECAALRVIKAGQGSTQTHAKSRFLPPARRARRGSLSLAYSSDERVA